ncbi:hypothetical protein KW807_01985 [Candidatus Parcubacteria bacterium]|nr:hypothetical protein [Candidatus Parcubacteria bacterium]
MALSKYLRLLDETGTKRETLITALNELQKMEWEGKDRLVRRFEVRNKLLDNLIRTAEKGKLPLELEFPHPLDPSVVEKIGWIQELCSQEGLECKMEESIRKGERCSGDEYDGPYEYTVTALTIGLPA